MGTVTPATDAPPRRTRSDALRNREKVLDAAQAAFSEQGLDAQMGDVARRAGVGIGTVYRAFPTKEALVTALLERHYTEMLDEVRMCSEHPDALVALRGVFEHAGRRHERSRALAEVVAAAQGDAALMPPSEFREQVEPLMKKVIDRGRASGALRPTVAYADLPPVFCALASVAGNGGDWRRLVDLVVDGMRAS